jgi:[ribosomal protein S18]-alanine N-acetyltransferase
MAADAKREQSERTIRAFLPEDIEAVTRISARASGAAQWTEESYREALEWPGIVAMVRAEDAEVIGFILGRQVADQGEILNLAVSPAKRRRGEGAALLGAALGEFRAHGVRRVFLEVRESNETAMAFYARHGFSKTGRRAGYYREPDEAAVLMEMKLGD